MENLYAQEQRKREEERNRNGGSLLNKAIDKLNISLNLPNYNYCGPGTKRTMTDFKKIPSINQLDEACKDHDIDYTLTKHQGVRNASDERLYKAAKNRIKSDDANFSEKFWACIVTAAMWYKIKTES